MKNVCFTISIHLKICCFRVPGTDDPEFFRSFDQELGVICGKRLGIATADWRAADWKGVDKVSLVVKAKG